MGRTNTAQKKTEKLAEKLHKGQSLNLDRFGYTTLDISSHPQSLRLLAPQKVWIKDKPLESVVKTIHQMRMNRVSSMNLTYPVIAWEYDGEEGSAIEADGNTSTRTCLEDFLELENTEDEVVLAFVKKWGVLDFCKWGIDCVLEIGGGSPGTEITQLQDDLDYRREFDPTYTYAQGKRDERLIKYWQREHREDEVVVRVFIEPIEAYRIYAREAAAMINIAASIYNNEAINGEDWHTMYIGDNPRLGKVLSELGTQYTGPPSPPRTLSEELPDTLSHQRYWLAERVNEWLLRAELQPALHWNKMPHAELRMDQNDAFSHVHSVSFKQRLVLQLVTTLCSRFYRCRFCDDGKGKWHPVEGYKRPGSICGSKDCEDAANREKVRKNRENNKASTEPASRGRTEKSA